MKELHPSYTNWIGDTFSPIFFPLHRPDYCEVYYEEMNCLRRFVGFRNSFYEGKCVMSCGCRWEGAPEDGGYCPEEGVW